MPSSSCFRHKKIDSDTISIQSYYCLHYLWYITRKLSFLAGSPDPAFAIIFLAFCSNYLLFLAKNFCIQAFPSFQFTYCYTSQHVLFMCCILSLRLLHVVYILLRNHHSQSWSLILNLYHLLFFQFRLFLFIILFLLHHFFITFLVIFNTYTQNLKI